MVSDELDMLVHHLVIKCAATLKFLIGGILGGTKESLWLKFI